MHKWTGFEVLGRKVVPNHNSYSYCLAKQKALMMPTDQIIQISKEWRWKIQQKLQRSWGEFGCHTHTQHYCISEERYKYLLQYDKNLDSHMIYKRGNKESHPKKLPYSCKIFNTVYQIHSIRWKNSWHHWLNTLPLKVPPSVPSRSHRYDLGSIVSLVKFI